jgi:uncharacterized protein YjdB
MLCVTVAAVSVLACQPRQYRPWEPTTQTIPGESLVIRPSRPQVVVGGSVQLSATPSNPTMQLEMPIQWTSSNPDVATVGGSTGPSALVTGIAPGEAMISALDARGIGGYVYVRVL